MAANRIPAETRFWNMLQKTDGCWPWTGSRNKKGYGNLMVDRPRTMLAHRFSWTIHNGEIPAGMRVLHRCDNPPCVNPAHLFLGTEADNAADRKAKGRNGDIRGEKHHAARLTNEIVLRIIADTRPHAAVAREYGVRPQTIYSIRLGKSWRHVTGLNPYMLGGDR